MALIVLHDVTWGFDLSPLLEKIHLKIEPGERVGLLGRNGVGKSTLLKLLAGVITPDSGDIWRRQGLRVALLEQEVPREAEGNLFEVVAEGLGAAGRALVAYHRLCHLPAEEETPETHRQREALQHQLEQGDGWTQLRQVESTLSRTRLDPEAPFADLSAGMKRRALFARALVGGPDLLLLDEPTNHLDIEAILWLEDFIRKQVNTLLFVTHDRAFLGKVADRIVELDRGSAVSYACGYTTYLKRREEDLAAEAKERARFDKKLSQEEVWIRQGIKARRTRNEGRVRALEKMRAAYRRRRAASGNVRLQVQEAERTGKLVIEAREIGFAHGERTIVRNFSTLIMRGDKVGLMGPNGIGKTTLIRLLLKEMAPDTGMVRHGTHLEVAYYDQLRAQLDEEKTVQENIGEGNDFLEIAGRRRHTIGYLQDFLFSPQRCRTPVHVLSGGEKNRLMLAKMLARPANLLILDEPTNDLDVETLELLEEVLLDYQGTLLVVSHDRAFLNNVVTRTLVFEGEGRVTAYAGGYDDWLVQRPQAATATSAQRKPAQKNGPGLSQGKRNKRTFSEEHELAALPAKIEALEAEQQALFDAMATEDFYKQSKADITALRERLESVETALKSAFARWEQLEEMDPE
jgi:ABC transport system ATP-binding/permease protein